MRSRQDRKSCQGEMLMTHKEKSNWCAREFATYKDPTVFAAASEVDNTYLFDLLVVTASCASTQWPHSVKLVTVLIFIEAPAEHRAKVGQHVLWQRLNVREGRRKVARAWQDHFVHTLLSKECPGTFKKSLKSPTIFFSSEIAMGQQVDDGYVTFRKHEGGVRISRAQKMFLKFSPSMASEVRSSML